MTQFMKLTLPWNRGANWRPQVRPVIDWTAYAAFEVPLTEGVHELDLSDVVDIPPDSIHAECFPIGSHIVSETVPAAEQAAAVAEALAGYLAAPLLIMPPQIPTADALAITAETVAAMIALGLNPRILYLPEYYWRAVGSPDLHPILGSTGNGRGLLMMAEPDRATWSVDNVGQAQPVYPGDDSPKWSGYGGLMSSEVAFLSVLGADVAGYRGTRDQLLAAVAPTPADPAPVAPVFPDALLRGTLLATGPDHLVRAAAQDVAGEPAAPVDAITPPASSGLAAGGPAAEQAATVAAA